MTGIEFSDAFDTLVNSYASNGNLGEQSSRQTPVFDEYEKSLFLTQAQEELVMSLYTGKNSYGESFESTEELREYLKVLINGTHKDLKLVEDIAPKQIVRYGNCKVYRVSDIASNIIGIIYEEVSFDDLSSIEDEYVEIKCENCDKPLFVEQQALNNNSSIPCPFCGKRAR